MAQLPSAIHLVLMLCLASVSVADDDRAVTAAAQHHGAFLDHTTDAEPSRMNCLVRWRGGYDQGALVFIAVDDGKPVTISEELIVSLLTRNRNRSTKVSLPGYSNDQSKAVIALMRGGEGYTAYLERRGERWVVVAIGGRWHDMYR